MHERELQNQLQTLRERMERVIGELQEVRAKVAATTIDVENQTVLRRLTAVASVSSPA